MLDAPTIHELMDQYKAPEASRRLATVILAPAVFGRPMVAPPGLPADRVKILREAYSKALKEPDLVEEARKRRWVLEPVSDEELESLAKEVISQPSDVIERMKKLLGK